jgi:ribosomal protein L35AE/L33A
MDDDTKNHAQFLILYQMIFVCKDRKKLLNTEASQKHGSKGAGRSVEGRFTEPYSTGIKNLCSALFK